jgi:hypothetical protein
VTAGYLQRHCVAQSQLAGSFARAAHTSLQLHTAGPFSSGNPGAGNTPSCGGLPPPAGHAGVPAPASQAVQPGQHASGAAPEAP